jgi:CheY-like chemotaxis protein
MKEVLYAEDDFTNRKLLQIKLTKEGIKCDSVENGKKAWEILQEDPKAYKILIVDLDMPEMSGLELCQKVREKGWEVPMISLTSDDSREKDLLAAGFNHVLIKPLLDNSYLEVIKAYL